MPDSAKIELPVSSKNEKVQFPFQKKDGFFKEISERFSKP